MISGAFISALLFIPEDRSTFTHMGSLIQSKAVGQGKSDRRHTLDLTKFRPKFRVNGRN